MKHKITIVGSGTAGTIVATALKRYWGDLVDITLIFDHKNPNIGVGEGTTPAIYDFIDFMGLSIEDLIRNTGTTVKLGIKFKSWTSDNKIFYHNFHQDCDINTSSSQYNYFLAQEILREDNYQAELFDEYFTDNDKIPSTGLNSSAVHFDATQFSVYLRKLYQSQIEIIDGVITDVIVKDNNIDKLILENGQEIKSDFYIDSTGFSKVLISKLNSEWVDKTDYLPLNRAIPCPIKKTYDSIPPYTLAEATKNGWIWQVPLSYRFGSGYLYSSKFTSDDEARDDFSKWMMENHGEPMDSGRVIKFDTGYFNQSWSGNCLSVGLSSGFVEPLEATAIHIAVVQTFSFISHYSLNGVMEHSRKTYNKHISSLYEEILQFIRFHYFTRRTDSDFWKYMEETTPEWIFELADKCKESFMIQNDIEYLSPSETMNLYSWSAISRGLGLFNKKSIIDFLSDRNLYNKSLDDYMKLVSEKKLAQKTAIDHKTYIDDILK